MAEIGLTILSNYLLLEVVNLLVFQELFYSGIASRMSVKYS